MANINLSEAHSVAELHSFGGINAQPGDHNGYVLSDIKNFRITESGTLEKRSGFSELLKLPGIPRAIVAVSEDEMFVLIGGQIYRSSIISGDCVPLSTVYSSTGDASFFKYGGDIFLLDGIELYRFNGNIFTLVEGYVPLYHKEADVDSPAPVHEPLNLLSTRYRVSYKIGDRIPSEIALPFMAATVDCVTLNGALISDDGCCLDSEGNYLNVELLPLQPKDLIEFSLTLREHHTSSAPLTSSTRAVPFGSAKNSHAESSVAFYGGNGGNTIFLTRPVDSVDYLKLQNVYDDLTTLYVSSDDMATLNGRITAAAPYGSSLAVFLDGSAYLAEENSGLGVRVSCMSRAHGCSVKDGTITLESSPITMSDTGIYLWHPHTVYGGEYTAECISLPVRHLLPAHIQSGFIYYHRSKNEIWCQAGEDRILVRNTVTGNWYTYEGFFPRYIFELGGRTAFVTDNTLFGFSDTLVSDKNLPISASITSAFIPFGDINRKKRLARAILRCSSRSSFTLTVIDAEGKVTDTELTDMGDEVKGYVEKRLPAKRSRYYSFTLSTRGYERATVNTLILTAVK